MVKHFGGTRALDHVDFSARAGEVHAVLGENRAGKSTLMKVICGAIQPDHGSLYLDGRLAHFRSPHQALESGVAIVHQQFTLAPELTVAENIFLGRLPRTRFGLTHWGRLFDEAKLLLGRLDFDLDPRRPSQQTRCRRATDHGAGSRAVSLGKGPDYG